MDGSCTPAESKMLVVSRADSLSVLFVSVMYGSIRLFYSSDVSTTIARPGNGMVFSSLVFDDSEVAPHLMPPTDSADIGETGAPTMLPM